MNKQEAIEKIEGKLMYEITRYIGKAVNIYDVIDIVKQIDEPKKPVVPQFVADWIEELKRDKKSLYYALESSGEVNQWLDRDDKLQENEDIFARAWLDGYEIEKEKLYTVEIPNHNDINFKHTILAKNSEGEVFLTKVDSEDWKYNYHYQLTESEIKQGFEWAWQFAEPVEENLMPEFYTTEDFTKPIECSTLALESIKDLYDEERIEDRENAEPLIDSYKYAIGLLTKEEVE